MTMPLWYCSLAKLYPEGRLRGKLAVKPALAEAICSLRLVKFWLTPMTKTSKTRAELIQTLASRRRFLTGNFGGGASWLLACSRALSSMSAVVRGAVFADGLGASGLSFSCGGLARGSVASGGVKAG